MKISTLLQQTGMWRAASLDSDFHHGTPTGFDALDERLAGGGWPASGITELLPDRIGIGELRLLAPALARLSQTQSRWLLWISPPFIPYPPALAAAGIDLSRVVIVRPESRADALWSLEQALASRSCSAVLAWPRTLKEKEIRRLQVASKDGHCLGILVRPPEAARNASPAELRLALEGSCASPMSDHGAVRVRILKRRGGWATDPFVLHFDDELNRMTPDYTELAVPPADELRAQQHSLVSENACGPDALREEKDWRDTRVRE